MKIPAAVKPVYSITPFTLLDYPDKTACILWFAGCNMKCLYCYNPDIVLGKGKHSYEEALKFIHSRKLLLDGVVLSGGECTSHKGITSLCTEIKKAGMLIKIDTNGSNPEMISKLITLNLVDYIALDYKAPSNKYQHITQSSLYNKFEQTLRILLTTGIQFEVRTTVHNDLLSEEDIQQMISYLEMTGYNGNLYIQHFINDTPTIGKLNNSYHKTDLSMIESDVIKVVLRN